MLKRFGVASVALALIVATVQVSAQDQNQPGQRGQRGQRGQGGQGQGGPGGRFGQGGPGGAFGFGGFGRGGGGLAGYLRVEEVREEIKMTEDQQTSLDEKLQALRGERGQGGRPNFQELSDEERAELRRQFEERAKKEEAAVAEVLDDAQLKRLKEIALQQRGVAALRDDEVAESLGLTALQREEIADTMEDVQTSQREKMQEIFQQGREGGGGFEGIREKMEELRAEGDQQILANLSDDQKTKFESMKGEAFEMPRPQFGGPGGPGRPGGPGAGGQGGRPGRPGGNGGNGARPQRPNRPDA